VSIAFLDKALLAQPAGKLDAAKGAYTDHTIADIGYVRRIALKRLPYRGKSTQSDVYDQAL
jgi:hypothetical protein